MWYLSIPCLKHLKLLAMALIRNTSSLFHVFNSLFLIYFSHSQTHYENKCTSLPCLTVHFIMMWERKSISFNTACISSASTSYHMNLVNLFSYHLFLRERMYSGQHLTGFMNAWCLALSISSFVWYFWSLQNVILILFSVCFLSSTC